jgi:hypothetical protein
MSQMGQQQTHAPAAGGGTVAPSAFSGLDAARDQPVEHMGTGALLPRALGSLSALLALLLLQAYSA